MKPSELPFYEDESRKKPEISIQVSSTFGVLQSGVSKTRIYVQDHTKPIQDSLTFAKDKMQTLSRRTKEVYSSAYNSKHLNKISVVGASASSGLLLQAVILPKSWYFRRFFTPVIFGTVAATYVYQDKAFSMMTNFKDSALKKIDELRN